MTERIALVSAESDRIAVVSVVLKLKHIHRQTAVCVVVLQPIKAIQYKFLKHCLLGCQTPDMQ